MKQMIRQMQLQKVIGEMRALLATFYGPMQGSTLEYKTAKEVIEDCISDLRNNFG